MLLRLGLSEKAWFEVKERGKVSTLAFARFAAQLRCFHPKFQEESCSLTRRKIWLPDCYLGKIGEGVLLPLLGLIGDWRMSEIG